MRNVYYCPKCGEGHGYDTNFKCLKCRERNVIVKPIKDKGDSNE